MNVEVSWLAVVLATLSTMVVGSVWYAPPIFGNAWAKMVGLDTKKMSSGGGIAIAITVVVSFFSAFVLAHMAFLAHDYFNNSFLQDSLSTAFWAWLGFTAARFITHDAFERRPLKLTTLNVAHEFVTFMVMGLIIGLLPPAM